LADLAKILDVTALVISLSCHTCHCFLMPLFSFVIDIELCVMSLWHLCHVIVTCCDCDMLCNWCWW